MALLKSAWDFVSQNREWIGIPTAIGMIGIAARWWREHKKRKHDESVNLGELAIRHHIETFPEQGAVGRKMLSKSEWISLMPKLSDHDVPDEILRRLGAKVCGGVGDGKLYMLIDLNEPAPPRRRG